METHPTLRKHVDLMNCTTKLWISEKDKLSQSKFLSDRLFHYRLIWYKQAMMERLLRFKHLVVILIALIIPTLSALPALIVSPFLFIVLPHPTSTPLLTFLASLIVHTTYILWVALQKEAIMGGQTMTYLSSFPLPPSIQRKIDLKLLLVANHLFWLPIMVSFLFVIKSTHYGHLDSFLPVFHWLPLISSLLLAQWLYLHKNFTLLILLCPGISSMLAFASWATTPSLSIVVSLTGILMVVWISLQKKHQPVQFIKPLTFFKAKQKLRFNWKLLSFIVIDCAILFRKYRQESSLRLVFSALSLIILYQISIRSSLNIGQIYPIAIAIPLLIASGWYNKLSLEHKQYHYYLSSLPVSPKSWVFLDISFVFLITLSLQALFFTPFLASHQLKFSRFCYAILAQVPLIVALYFSQTKLSKLCHVVGATLTGLWLSLFFVVG